MIWWRCAKRSSSHARAIAERPTSTGRSSVVSAMARGRSRNSGTVAASEPGVSTVSPSMTATTASSRGRARATARSATANACRLPRPGSRTSRRRTRSGGSSSSNRRLIRRSSAVSTIDATSVTGPSQAIASRISAR
jgi:hypothetical protein